MTKVLYKGYEVTLNDASYYDANSIKINPKGALTITGIVLPLAGVAVAGVSGGLGLATTAIFGSKFLGLLAGSGAAIGLIQTIGDLTTKQKHAVYDSIKFSIDYMLYATKASADGEGEHRAETPSVPVSGSSDVEVNGDITESSAPVLLGDTSLETITGTE